MAAIEDSEKTHRSVLRETSLLPFRLEKDIWEPWKPVQIINHPMTDIGKYERRWFLVLELRFDSMDEL
ncbi:hypothetical protein N7516_000886 [Penicillium verrucosum]|uniref:uncharacterized protein n=1 Tax=Penicillium verrucosum TaxID=60171 RepID=UPI002545600A|nr:uncharacterized protein N7516_000886 [Penicillium verrucosum]KAJ5940718.1 hypothetical protein N7516_000886 [Penicillium verrucosum]